MFESLSLIVLIIVFISAFVSGSLGYGGGFVLVAAMASTNLPIHHVVPLSAVFSLGFVLSRLWLWRDYVDWSVVRPFWLGAIFGTAFGAQIYSSISAEVVSFGVGVSILLLLWLPTNRIKWSIPSPVLFVGVAHSLVSTMFGVGSLGQGYVTRLEYCRFRLSATIAGMMSGLILLKIIGYSLVGFNYQPYLLLIFLGVIVSIIATLLGRSVMRRIDEKNYRLILKAVMTIMAVRLIIKAFI